MWQIIINGPGYFDTCYELPEGSTTLGRADENDIVLSGDLVSRKHARIHINSGLASVEDLGSRNGCRLNGEPVKGTRKISAGDTLNVGENTLHVRNTGDEPKRPPPSEPLGSGVRLYHAPVEIGDAVLLAKGVRDSSVLRALDNVVPFSTLGDLSAPISSPQPIAYESLFLLYKIAELLSGSKSLHEFLEEALDRVMGKVNATTAVVLFSQKDGKLRAASVRHRGSLGAGEVPVSDAIVEAALRQGAALAVAAVHKDRRFADRESVLLYGANQVLCVPIGAKPPFYGVFYLNRPSADETGLDELLELCTAVAHHIANAVQRFGGVDKPAEEPVRAVMKRVLPPEAAERALADLSSRSPAKSTHLDERTATLMSVEISGFEDLVRSLPPGRVLEIINAFHQRMTALLFSFEATVDRFAGNSVTAIFGAPLTKPDDSKRAARAGMALRTDWSRLTGEHPEGEHSELRIGLATGRLLTGVVGFEGRVDHSVLGEPVVLASLLRGAAEPGQILVCPATYASLGQHFNVRPMELRVGGLSRVYELLEEDIGYRTHPGLR